MITWLKSWYESYRLQRHTRWMLRNPLGVNGRIISKCSGKKKKCKWVLQENSAKRICDTCKAEDWIFTNPYPAVGEPAHTWRRMQ